MDSDSKWSDEMTCNEKNEFYMYTKYKKMGHILHVRNDWKKEE